jgi:biopolymer transport protein ExbD
LAGRRVRCPNCDTAVHVPELEVDPESKAADDHEVVVEAVPVVEDIVEDIVEPVRASETQVEAVLDYSSAAIAPVAESVAASGLPSAEASETDDADDADDHDEEDDQVLVRSKRAGEEMDMTPMVDVTFLLLIFFMVTAAFSLQKSIVMPRQQTDAPSTSVVEEESEDLDMVEVQVDEFGSYLVMAQDWEREVPGKQNLIRALKEAIAGHKDGMRLAIKVHERAELHALVDSMDAGTIAGYAELEVTQVEEFD